ncbi:MAG TPA: hypothetical protein VFZ65_02770 [Planctomycetota bacterium]|nr:hypothetical protein [Planctomycetota bacterium]
MRSTITTLLLAAALPCQAAFTTFGSGCSLQSQTPAIGNNGLPQIGQTFSITYTGPNYLFSSAQQMAQPFLALGTQPLFLTIPAGLLIYQPAGCVAYLEPLSLTPMAPDPILPSYVASYAIAVPNDAGLIGFQFLAQWLLVHSQCGFAGCGLSGLITSDAATITVGL